MTLDTQTFFYIILSGFITVWTFRYLTKSKKSSDSFEYLCLSAFWGVAILLSVIWYLRRRGVDPEKMQTMFSNPFVTGFMVSALFGSVFGLVGSLVAKPIAWIIETYKQSVLVKLTKMFLSMCKKIVTKIQK
jgi:hypothetical protein